ncbi:SnoaL domain-containing protein [Trichoderma velutinum]
MPSLEERNKAVVSEYFEEYWVKGNVNVVDELCSDDFLQSYPNHGPRHGKEGAKAMLRELWSYNKAFPDLTFRAYQTPLIAEGDYVAAQWVGGGTHTGRAFDDLTVGELKTSNTGKKIHFSGMTIFTLKNGKIVREIAEEGGITVLQQLGLVTPPNPGKEIVYDKNGDQVY